MKKIMVMKEFKMITDMVIDMVLAKEAVSHQKVRE